MFAENQCVKEIYNPLPSCDNLSLMKQNLEDPNHPRYLMCVSKSGVCEFILEKELEKLKIKGKTIVGSKFEDDLKDEEY